MTCLDSPLLLKYDEASMRIHDIFLKAWNLDSFLKHYTKSDGDPAFRLIIASDGTITRTLQVLHLCPIDLEVREQSKVHLDPDIAKYLEISDPQKVISRKVWLKKAHQRLLYASTILAFSQRDQKILKEILLKEKPLGLLLEEYHLPSLKDKLTIGRLVHPGIAEGLGLAAATELWARHYRLTIQDRIRASVLEVFSPAAFRAD